MLPCASVPHSFLRTPFVPSLEYHLLLVHSPFAGFMGCSHVGVPTKNAARPSVPTFFCGHRFAFLLGEYLGAELLSQSMTLQ